jgi:hypothetical protein
MPGHLSRSSVHAAHRAVAAVDEVVRLLVEQAPLPDAERAIEHARAATGGLLGWTSAEALTRLIVEVVRCARQGQTVSPDLGQARQMLADALMYDDLLPDDSTTGHREGHG